MKDAAPAPQARTATPDAPPRPSRAAEAWLALLFWLAARVPWLLRLIRPVAVRATVWSSPYIRRNTALNAARIFRRPLGRRERGRFARGVVASFYDFVVDVGRSRSLGAQQLCAMVERVEGHDRYVASRQAKRGAILVTAHMGSFEVGLAALRQVDAHVHVVFKRDAFVVFETLRAEMRTRLGVHEAAIDDGWATLLKLREALESDQVIVMQGDRAMPGQRAQAVPILGGHLALPLGPVTLSRLVGSPIVPVFTVRTGLDRYAVHLLEPIFADAEPPGSDGLDPALVKVGQAIERFVAAHPEQWLVLEPAFAEDRPRGR